MMGRVFEVSYSFVRPTAPVTTGDHQRIPAYHQFPPISIDLRHISRLSRTFLTGALSRANSEQDTFLPQNAKMTHSGHGLFHIHTTSPQDCSIDADASVTSMAEAYRAACMFPPNADTKDHPRANSQAKAKFTAD